MEVFLLSHLCLGCQC